VKLKKDATELQLLTEVGKKLPAATEDVIGHLKLLSRREQHRFQISLLAHSLPL
jgi:hypothetical protein